MLVALGSISLLFVRRRVWSSSMPETSPDRSPVIANTFVKHKIRDVRIFNLALVVDFFLFGSIRHLAENLLPSRIVANKYHQK